MEQWKTITTHPNYEISNLGRVRNKQTNEFKQTKPCKHGYIKVNLYPGPKVFMVHRLVAEYFLPKIPGKELVNHIDSIRHNNFVTNLEWCDYKENAQHMVKQGNNPDHNGVNNPSSKFTEQQILDIRADSRSVETIAKDYNVSPTTITNIKNGTRYKNVGGNIRTKKDPKYFPRGSKINTSRIDEDTAKKIKYWDKTTSHREISKLLDVSYDTVCKIRTGKTWRHI